MSCADADYHAIEPDPEKHPSEYSTAERRADVLDHIVSRGSPSAISQSRLAERYEVAQSTVSRDVDVLGEAVAEHLGDHLKLATRALHDRLVADLSEADDWRAQKAAWDLHMEYVTWAGVEPANDTDREPRPPGENAHELTDQQQEHFRQLKERARDAMVTRDDATATVPDTDAES